jgi:hypothetical protein
MALMPILALVLLFATSHHGLWHLIVPSWEACGPEPGKSSHYGPDGAAVGIVNASC